MPQIHHRASTMLFALLSLTVLQYASCTLMTQPEQIHISYGATPDQMMVTWVTVNRTRGSVVEFGVGQLTEQANGSSSLFVDGGPAKRSMYIHRVLLTSLQSGQTYAYHCGSPDGWSGLFWFTAMNTDPNYVPTLAVYGDLGNVNGKSIPRLQEEVQRGVYDSILHIGDIAYDMDTDDARVGDEFMRQMEPIAAYVPYMTCVGNHEQAYNFSNYDNRFSMMNLNGNINNFFYSFNLGPAHIIAFSTEFYYYLEYGMDQILNQYLWLEEDLQEASKPENRALRPWIITMGHRPFYCSTTDNCLKKMDVLRRGFPVIHAFGLEDLFYKHGVDLELWGHEHAYERLWPVYNETVFNGSTTAPYTNPKAPVHIITGSPGNQENHTNFIENPADWSAFRNSDYGYSRMKIFNGTHIQFQQISDDQGGAIVDDFWIIKDKHGFEAWS